MDTNSEVIRKKAEMKEAFNRKAGAEAPTPEPEPEPVVEEPIPEPEPEEEAKVDNTAEIDELKAQLAELEPDE